MKRPLLVLAATATAATATSADITFTDFTSTTGLNLVGTTSSASGLLRLTGNGGSENGAAWFETKQNVAGGFDTTFEFRMISGGADGMAFVIQNESPTALADCGGAMGFGVNPGGSCDPSNPASFTNALAIELDCYVNGGWGDPSDNHIGVMAPIAAGVQLADHSNSLGEFSPAGDLNDGSPHAVRVTYDGATLEVYYEDLLIPQLSVSVDLNTVLNLDQGTAWVGFTGATGGVTQTHAVRNWTFTETSSGVFNVDTNQLSLSAGGTVTMSFSSDPVFASLPYLVLGSASGTSPGFIVDGLTLPLVPDAYWQFTLLSPNTPPLGGTFGFLDINGAGTSTFTIPPGTNPNFAGVTFSHAALVIELLPTLLHVVHTTNAASFQFVP